MQCRRIKSNGERCNASAMSSSSACFRHNKSVRCEALQASSEGGQAKRQHIYLGSATKLKTPKDIKNLMERALNSLWTGKMPSSNPAGALGYLSKVFLEAYSKSELEARIELLEQRLNDKNI